ncbi:glycosyltransferase [Gaetbulibacter sp. PBL-D1]|uniref:glycosyltransferase n=1 Tax=Gaetbulibacter sp. PBL-D1 TaxID=3422594 RepID=UPI003D2ED57D
MKKIAILGPISDLGGIGVEVNTIALALEINYNVKIISTNYISEKASAVQNLKFSEWVSIPSLIMHTNKVIFILTAASRFWNKKKQTYNFQSYIENSVSKKIYDFDKLYLKQLYEELKSKEVVIVCAQITYCYLSQIIEFCHQNNIQVVVRTAETIKAIDVSKYQFLKKVSLFLHHSENNAKNLNKQIGEELPYIIVDQCVTVEENLLKLPISFKKPLRFGFLGRIEGNKNVLTLARFFAKADLTFIIAGKGNQLTALIEVIKDAPKCQYLGVLKNDEIVDFFEKIDVLIISSSYEAGPLVGLEAMAAGKLLLSTEVGAMTDRLSGINSFWLDSNLENSLCEHVSKLNDMSDLECENFASKLRSRYKERYNVKYISSLYNKVVKSLIK